jgi:predicted dehydrogenase
MRALSELRVAILGVGMIGEVHRRASALTGARLLGVMASTPDKSRQVAERWQAPEFYDDIDQVASSDADVVHICAPNAFHVPYAVQLARTGKHIICEKPLGVSLSEARGAAEAAADAGVVNTIPFAYRFHPMAREMRARVAAADFGPVYLIHGSYLQDWMLDPRVSSWRVDPNQGGPSRAFADIGSHWCDLAEFVTGERIDALAAATSIAIPERPAATEASFTAASSDAPLVAVTTEDSACVLFRTRGGITGNVTISQVSAGRKNRLWLEVDGGHRSAVFDQEDAEHLWIGSPEGAMILNRDPNHGSADQRRLSTLPAGHAQGYAQCFEHFVADTYTAVLAASTGNPVPPGLPTFADGARAAALSEAVLHSARSGGWVRVHEPAETMPCRGK